MIRALTVVGIFCFAAVGYAQFNVCGDTNLPGNYVTHVTTPSATDARITGKNANQRAFLSTNAPPRNQLVVFFPGTGGVPASFDNFCQNAANLGFHALALTYDNDVSLGDFCGTDPDLDCYFKVRMEFLTGLNTTTKTNITRANSIEFRLAAFLNYLHTNYPSENWGQYLTASNQFWTNVLAWNKFLLAGHSQGSGYAAFIAKLREVQRVVTFAGGDFSGLHQQAATWNFLPSATPTDRWFGFTHYKDAGEFDRGQQIPNWEAQDFVRFGPMVDLATKPAPYDYTHTFTSTLEPCPNVFGNIEYHGAPVNDPPQVRDTNGNSFYQGVWTHMLVGPTTPPALSVVIADSVRDFSNGQASNDWQYGYWNRSADINGIYTFNDFLLLPTYSNTLYAIPGWILSNDLQVAIWSTGARPHFVNTNDCCTNHPAGPEVWPVRRWTSTVSGPVTIAGSLSKWDSAGGDGVTGVIKVNGNTVWSAFLEGTNIFGTNFSFGLNLAMNSAVDFMVSPGTDANHDGTRFTAQILGGPLPGSCAMPLVYSRLLSTNEMELRWETCTNFAYQVEQTDRFHEWKPASPPLAAAPGGGWVTNVVAVSTNPTPYRFYRVRVIELTNSVVPQAPGVYPDLYLTHAGIVRHYRLNIPTNYNPSIPMPLALIIHGHDQTADEFAGNQPELAQLAAVNGVILAYPDGTLSQRGTGWNTVDPTPDNPVDDVGFLLALIDSLDGTLNIDRKRVYAGGFSNGGQMVHFLGARTTNVFAAFASIGSAIGGDRGNGTIEYIDPPTQPAPMLIINATNDCKRPYWGGVNEDGSLQAPSYDAVIHWTNANLCAPSPVKTTNVLRTNHVVRVFASCAGPNPPFNAVVTNYVTREHYQTTCTPGTEVLFITTTDGGHSWPETSDNVGVSASREVMEFFLRHCRCDAVGASNAFVAPTAPGNYNLSLCDQNYWRTLRMQIPTGYNPAVATPLVFTMHGGGQTMQEFASAHPALFSKCDSEGVILVLPAALEHPATRETLWHNKPFDYVADDRYFLTNLIEQLDATLNLERRRIYACGFSSGGSFSHYFAATMPGVLAAIGPVCTQTGWNDPVTGAILAPPAPLEPLPVMMVRGGSDSKRPYNGGLNIDNVLCRSAADDVNYWTNGNMCASSFTSNTTANVTTYRYTACAPGTEVILVRVGGMPHIWPDASDGFTFDANVTVINFLLRFTRP